jgi:1,4-dihydroxy-2-naphthoate octaprenyltransferase
VTPVRAWLALARPQGAPWTLALPLVGFGLAHWDRALALTHPEALPWVLFGWLGIHVGTMWWNAAFDNDDGDVLFGRSVPVPPGTRTLGTLALGLGVASAAVGGALIPALGCALLAIAYSHPATGWKAHPVLGPVVNVVGFGWLTPAAGFAVVGVPWDARIEACFALIGAWTLGAFFAAQAFQEHEDRARGYRTLVAVAGPKVALQAARVSIGAGAVGVLGLSAIGWLPRAILLTAPAWLAVDRSLAEWSRVPGGGDLQRARGWFDRMVVAAGALVAAAFATYLWQSWSGAPPAGLGTAAGLPPDASTLLP